MIKGKENDSDPLGAPQRNRPTATVLSVKAVDPERELRTTDVAAIDLSDPNTWGQSSLLLKAKFLTWLEDKFPTESRKFEQGCLAAERSRELFDEFLVEQARTIGLRILFCPTSLLRLYDWSQNPDSGHALWYRFAKNIQSGLDNKRVLIQDVRTPAAKDDLLKDVKILKRMLRKKKASSLPWDLEWHLKNVRESVPQLPGETLVSNLTLFVDFLANNEDVFMAWLLPSGRRVNDAKLVDAFLAQVHGYSTSESARQAIQAIKRRHTPHRKST